MLLTTSYLINFPYGNSIIPIMTINQDFLIVLAETISINYEAVRRAASIGVRFLPIKDLT